MPDGESYFFAFNLLAERSPVIKSRLGFQIDVGQTREPQWESGFCKTQAK